MRRHLRPRIVLVLLLAALVLVLGRVASRTAAPRDADWELAREVVSAEVWESMSAEHRSFLVGIMRANLAAGRPVMAACWENSAGNQAQIDAFNAAMTYGGANGPEFQQAGRWTTGALVPSSVAQGDPVTLTYSFVPDGTTIPAAYSAPSRSSDLFAWLNNLYGSPAVWQQIFHDEFQRWADRTGINFVYEPNDDGAALLSLDGVAGVRGDIRISAGYIDGNSSILAYAYYPNAGDMVFESQDTWYNTTSNSSRRLRNVISHELGHSIGMAHVCPADGTKIMEPYINTAFLGGQEDDVLNGQRHYGDPYESNDNLGTAADLGTLGNGLHGFVDMSIDDDGDVDWYKFDITAPKTLDLTLRPIGSSYLEGPQTSACDTGVLFSALLQQDLEITLYAANGITQLGAAAAAGIGQNEQILGIDLFNPGVYYLKVAPTGANDTIQRYELDLDLQTFVPAAFSIAIPEGDPTSLVPEYETPVRVVTTNIVGAPDPMTAVSFASVDGGPFLSRPMVDLGGGVWWAKLPAASCYSKIDWYLEIAPLGGGAPERYPPSGASDPYAHAVADDVPLVDVFADDFTNDLGWQNPIGANVTAGRFMRVFPGPANGGPASDYDGSGTCFLTGNGLQEDVDGGTVRLISPNIDLSGQVDPIVRFAVWFSNDGGPNPGEDPLEVFLSSNGGTSWTLVETIANSTGGWVRRAYRIADHVALTTNFKFRLRTSDSATSDSTVEAALDDFHVSVCDTSMTLAPCAAGSMGILNGAPVDIFGINGSAGGPTRTVVVPVGTGYTSILSNPPGYGGAGYAMFARIGRPGPAEVIEVTPTAGSMCFVPSPLDPANPSLATVAWTYPGTVPGNPPLASGTPTPWFAFNAGIPFPIEAAIQTIISEGPYLRVSNMVILKVQ
ncbi:MAG: matrixin family metalloprotease [Planctomycetes bacterium]|nr:matrixin family metalloprotease [Planctomycetota bacterium]